MVIVSVIPMTFHLVELIVVTPHVRHKGVS